MLNRCQMCMLCRAYAEPLFKCAYCVEHNYAEPLFKCAYCVEHNYAEPLFKCVSVL